MSLLEVLKEFFWLPILSAMVGIGVENIIKIIRKKCKEKKELRKYKDLNVFSIEGNWNSFFREENVLKNEKVVFKQEGNRITGNIFMDDKTYEFNGVFKNNILFGNYESNDKKNDERGSIVLRYINGKLLSGYCTFVYKNRQVYNSPYILTLESEHKVDKGTYKFCNDCVGKRKCCCNSSKVDMPILLPFEVEKISKITKRNIDEFAEKKTNNLYQMKRENDDEKKGCIFFQNNKCSIYDTRPVDCRLFPFDFKEIDGEYKVIYYDKICDSIPIVQEEIDMCAYNLRPLLDLAMPYISECSDPIFCKRLDKQHYEELFPISSIRDDIK